MTALTTTSITTNGTTTPFDFSGGLAATIATGTFNGGILRLEYSLDDTNYATVGKESIKAEAGGFLFELPACKLRWNFTESTGTPAVSASVESI